MLPDLARADAATLRLCLGDVLALSTLPAVWAGAKPLRIAESLAAALYSILGADFVYVTLLDGAGGSLASVAQTSSYESDPQLANALGASLLDWVRQHDPYDLFICHHPSPEVPLRVTCRPLGYDAELGVLAAGFAGDDLPAPLHHLLLDLAATQATTGAKNALLVQALRQSEERFRALIEASSQIVWTRTRDGRATEDSPSWRAFTGQTYAEWKGFGWLDAVHPEDRPRIEALWHAAVVDQMPAETEYRLRHVSGEWRWITVRAVPRLEASGTVQEWVGMITDISARKAAEQTQQLLLGELNHRVKNTLANVQAIAQHTLRRSKSPAEFASAFGGRVQALARVHTQLTQATWQGADLQALVRDQVLPMSTETGRLSLQGPHLMLSSQAALHLALVLHELGTNSRKYGALSNPNGVVTVIWTGKGEHLHLQWSERGGPPVEVPSRQGFGTTLIQSSVQSMGGKAQVVCAAEGLGWEIELPLELLRARAATGSVTNDAVQGSGPPARDFEQQNLAGKRILVVEDEVMVALDLVATLELEGVHTVGPATSIESALAAAAEPIDAALLDANLAGVQVDAVAAALTRKGVPFVFVTGYTRDSLPAAFRGAPLLTKPFTGPEVIAALRRALSVSPGTIRLRHQPDSSW